MEDYFNFSVKILCTSATNEGKSVSRIHASTRSSSGYNDVNSLLSEIYGKKNIRVCVIINV